MAARADAVATRSPKNAVNLERNLESGKSLSTCLSCLNVSEYKYNWQDLLNNVKKKGLQCFENFTTTTIKERGKLQQPSITPDSTKCPPERKRFAGGKKRSEHRHIRPRLMANPTTAKPCRRYYLQMCKINHIRLLMSAELIPDSAIQLEELVCYRTDRALVN